MFGIQMPRVGPFDGTQASYLDRVAVEARRTKEKRERERETHGCDVWEGEEDAGWDQTR